MFTYLDFSHVPGGADAACDRLPDQPAVYSFFRNIRLPPPEASATEFLSAINAAISARAAPDRFNRVGPLHTIRLECRSDLTDSKSERLVTLAQDAPFRGFLRQIVETASLLQSPLY